MNGHRTLAFLNLLGLHSPKDQGFDDVAPKAEAFPVYVAELGATYGQRARASPVAEG
jgi:hypothetical protein